MEILEDLEGGKVYLDTNVFIYAVEAVTEYMAAVEALFGLLEDGTVNAVTSELALAEVLAKPFEIGRHDIAGVYEAMLTPSMWLAVLPIDRSTLIEQLSCRPGSSFDFQTPSTSRQPSRPGVARCSRTTVGFECRQISSCCA